MDIYVHVAKYFNLRVCHTVHHRSKISHFIHPQMQIASQVWTVLFQTACCMTCIGCGAKRAKFNNGKINKEMCRILTDFQSIKGMEITDIYFFKVKQHKVSADGWRKQSRGTRLFSEKLLREVCNSVTKTKQNA